MVDLATGSAGFADLVMLARVEKAVDAGARLARWGWPVPAPYNGATGLERISAWQKLYLARSLGWMPSPLFCSICRGDQRLHQHAENYFRPFIVHAICQRCHFCLHRRFRRPARWLQLLHDVAYSPQWAREISLAELSRTDALRLARG
jgi:hypothetical protein